MVVNRKLLFVEVVPCHGNLSSVRFHINDVWKPIKSHHSSIKSRTNCPSSGKHLYKYDKQICLPVCSEVEG